MFDFGIDLAWRDFDGWKRPVITVNYVCGCWQVFYRYSDEGDWCSVEMGRGNSRFCRYHEHVALLEEDRGPVQLIYDRGDDEEIRRRAARTAIKAAIDHFQYGVKGTLIVPEKAP